MRPLLRLAARNLGRHPWRSTATVLGIALGIAAVLGTMSVGENVRANVREALEAAAGKADLLITPGAQGRAVFALAEPVALAAATPGVEAVLPVLNSRSEPLRDVEAFQASIVPGVDTGFQLSGRLTERADSVPATLLSGRLPSKGSAGIAVTAEFARVRSLSVGDDLVFATRFGEVPFRITGLLDDRTGLASTNGGRIGIVHLDDLQERLHLEGRSSFLEVHLSEGAPGEATRATLQEKLGEEFTVTLPAGSGNVASGLVETIQAGLSVLAATLLALGGFMAYNTFMASVVERTRDYALLRTICLRRGQVQQLALFETLLVSVLGVVAGIGLGVLLAYGINRFNALHLGYEFRTLVVPLRSVALASVVGVSVSLLAGLLPARLASRTTPLSARFRAETAVLPVRLPLLGALALAMGIAAALLPWKGLWALLGAAGAMGLLFVGMALASPWVLAPVASLARPLLQRFLGTAGKLGAGFAARNAARNGVALGTVIVGIALVVGVGAMVAGINRAIDGWVDSTIVGDMFVTSPVSFPEDFERRIRASVPGVEAVSGVALRVVRMEHESARSGRQVVLVLVEPERFSPGTGFGRFQFIQGQGDVRSGYEALLRGGKVLASNTMLDRFGIGRGESVSLRTSGGFQDFDVAGVVVDFTGGGETFVTSIRELGRFGGGTPDLYVMTVVPGTRPEEAREQLRTAFPELHLDITLNADYRSAILAMTQRSFATTNTLLFLAVLIAALGVANTLGMNLYSRQHEIGVLRTLGLTRRGVRRLITAEGTMIMVLGTLCGIGAGLLLGQVITAGANALTGYRIAPVYPARLVFLALVASPLIGILASLLPARRAARLSPVTALGPME